MTGGARLVGGYFHVESRVAPNLFICLTVIFYSVAKASSWLLPVQPSRAVKRAVGCMRFTDRPLRHVCWLAYF